MTQRKLYIYIFEDGQLAQSYDKPTEEDEVSMDEGLLDVIVVDTHPEDGDLVASYYLNGNAIDRAKERVTEDGNKYHSYRGDFD